MWGPEGPRVSRPVCPWGTNVKFYSGRVTGREASLLTARTGQENGSWVSLLGESVSCPYVDW